MNRKFKVGNLVLFKSYAQGCDSDIWKPGVISKHLLPHYSLCSGILISEMYEIEYRFSGNKYYALRYTREVKPFNIDNLNPSVSYGKLLV